MIDWGLSGAIVAVIAFVSSMLTDTKLKKLSNKVAELEKALVPVEGSDNDGGNSDD